MRIIALVMFLGVIASVSIGNSYAIELNKYENIRGETIFVTEKTAVKLLERGYLVDTSEFVKTSFDLNQRWIHTPVYESQTASSAGTIPIYEFDLPKYITVGQEFEINIPYTFVIIDPEDGEIDDVIEPFGPNDAIGGEVGTSFHIAFPDDWLWLNPDNSTYYKIEYYDEQWDKSYSELSSLILYNDEAPQNINLQFLLNDTIDYPHNYFEIGVDFKIKNYYMNSIGNNVWEIGEILVIPNFAPGTEPQPPYPNRSIGGYGNTTSVDSETIWPDMELMADDLENLDVDWTFEGTFDNLEEMLRDNFRDDWVDEFLEKYPQYKANFILPSLNWVLPEAYGASSYSLVRGDVKIEELKNRFVNPSVTLKYCVYDKDLSSKTDSYTVLTTPSGKQACDDIENGRFSILTTNVDPDGDGTKPDFSIGIILENESVKLTPSNADRSPPIFHSTTLNDHSRTLVSFVGSNKITIPQSDDFFKSYSVFKTSSDTLSKFDKLGARGFPILTVFYNSDYNSNTVLQYTHNTVTVDDLYKRSKLYKKISDSPVTISHEVGHFIQDKTYKNVKGATYRTPDCSGVTGVHYSFIVTNDQCAWSEGWATFVGIFANDVSVYRTFVGSYLIDFESGTKNGIQFPTNNGVSTEGWVTSALWDIHDKVDETRDATSYDRIDDQSKKIWHAFSIDRHPSGRYIASDVNEFKDDWDGLYPRSDIGPIFRLNHLLPNTPTSVSTSNSIVFSDTFTSSFTKWILSGDEDWDITLPEEEYVPNTPRTNKVAHADNCDDECIITMKNSIDLSSRTSAELSFWLFVDRSVDGDEGLKLEISTDNGRTWSQLGLWTDNTGDDTDNWVFQRISLNNHLDNNVKIRFTAMSSSSSEDLQIDDVLIK